MLYFSCLKRLRAVNVKTFVVLINKLECWNRKKYFWRGLNDRSSRGTIFTTLHFLHNLQMRPISASITQLEVGKACQGQTLQLIGPIRNLQRKDFRSLSLSVEWLYLGCAHDNTTRMPVIKPYVRKELLSRINWIYYWRLICFTHEHYNYSQLM